MRTSISKKLLAGALSVMMVLSLFAGVPANKAQAAASVKVTGKTAVYTGTTNTYKVVNLKKAQYVKVSVTGDAKKLVTVKKGSKKLATTKKVYGGKTITLKVANKKAAGKKYTLVVKAYKKGATKPFKTIKKTVTVYSKTTSVTLDQTEATLKVGETVTLTATKKPAKNTKAIKWTSSDETVATVADGVVTAVAAGTATIKATSGAKSATATITVEEAKKEAELVDLKVTGSKVLTATLSAAAEITAKDVVVKKGTVTLTPADVKVDGTNLVITLGSKISKDTYSVTYKEKTLTVEAEDEKLVELKTVGTALALTKDTNLTSDDGVDSGSDPQETQTVNGEIEYQALNQYGEPMNAEITSVSSTFGGKANFTEPTTKKNGVISIVNINAVLGIAGTQGKVIIVAKSGVSTTNDVVFSEEAKVAKVEFKGILDVQKGEIVETIPAEIKAQNIGNYKLVIKAYNQYDQEIAYSKFDQKLKGQSFSVAQVLSNVTIPTGTAGKLDQTSYDQLTVKDEDVNVLNLIESTGNTGTIKAGTFQVIIVGDRFGTVMNQTITVEQITLLKSFTYSAPDRVYNGSDNKLEYTAIDTKGNEVKDYKTLTNLVTFADTDPVRFVRNTDGSAALVIKPTGITFNNADNNKETTVISVTATCNKLSPADLLVAPKTFTVWEDKEVVSLVKYAGNTADAYNQVVLSKGGFVYEDQYGNTITSADPCYANIRYDWECYKNGVKGAYDSDSSEVPFTNNGFVTSADKTTNYVDASAVDKIYVSIANQSNKNSQTDEFDKTKAQVVINISEVDVKKAGNLTATWVGPNWDGALLRVHEGDDKSGIVEANFKVTGYVGGKKVTIPTTNYTIVEDTYKPITKSEFAANAALTKKATATINVVLSDGSEEYTESITCEYEYSAQDSVLTALYNYNDWTGASGSKAIKAKYTSTTTIGHDYLAGFFYPVDQYGDLMDVALSLTINKGDHTDAYTIKSPNTTLAYIAYEATATDAQLKDAVFSIIAKPATGTGIEASQTFKVTEVATKTIEEEEADKAGAKTTAQEKIDAFNLAWAPLSTENYAAISGKFDEAKTAVEAYEALNGSLSDLSETDKYEAAEAALRTFATPASLAVGTASYSVSGTGATLSGAFVVKNAAGTDITSLSSRTYTYRAGEGASEGLGTVSVNETSGEVTVQTQAGGTVPVVATLSGTNLTVEIAATFTE